MSHLLYLRSFKVEAFVRVFGGGNAALADGLLPSGAPASARAALANAVTRGLEWPSSDTDRKWLEAAVSTAIGTKKYGIGAKPISPMGAGGPIFDDHAAYFEEAGRNGKKLLAILQRGRNYEGGCILLSPEDVTKAAKILGRIGEESEDEYFVSELAEPFARAAKQGLAVFGEWG